MTRKELDYESWETPTETSKQAKDLKEERGLNTHTHTHTHTAQIHNEDLRK